METLIIIIGLVGAGLVLAAYGLLSSGKLRADDLRYQLINISGTIGLLLSLIVQYNRPALVLNGFWLAIGLVGLVRILRIRKAGRV